LIYHIARKAEWDEALRQGGYEPASLRTEGFVHCSTLEQTLGTANRFFRGQLDLVLLCIEPSRLTAEVRLEPPADVSEERARELFPHVYGPINLDAVIKVVAFPCEADGSFRLPEGLPGSRAPYKYLLSIPERVIRSLSALSGGLLREIGNVAVPASLRRTTLYRTMVEVTLRFLIEDVGQVDGVYPPEGKLAENFLLQRTASHGIELLGILAFQASPVWVLAALADAAGGSRKLIREISQALQEEGLLEKDERFETMEQVLDGLQKSSGRLATALNLPPVDIRSLRREWDRLKEGLRGIPPKNVPSLVRVERVWKSIQESAREQGRPVFLVSSVMAISAVAHVPANVLWLSRAARSATRRTGKVLGEAVLDHYTTTLAEIGREGFLRYWTREFRPYLRGAAEQFAPAHESLTERLLRRK
jgi:uncharacterized protein (DUF952 family)